MSENPSSTQCRRNANFPVGLPVCCANQTLARLLARWWGFWRAWPQAAIRGSIRFQKYRVAPRLGTDTVRRRLLLRLDQAAPLAATETGLA
jgi:hypothetical protein